VDANSGINERLWLNEEMLMAESLLTSIKGHELVLAGVMEPVDV
jgi:hypothetical protein